MLLKFCLQDTSPPLTSFSRGSSGGGLLSRPLIFHKIRALFFCPEIDVPERPRRLMCGPFLCWRNLVQACDRTGSRRILYSGGVEAQIALPERKLTTLPECGNVGFGNPQGGSEWQVRQYWK
jgi:hypothetical protein